MGNERRSRYESAPRPARQERSRGMPSARASSGWSRSRFPLSAPSAPGRSGPASLRRRVPAARSVGSGLRDRTRRGGPGGGPLDREREGLAGRLTTTAALRGRLGGTSCLATTTPLDRRSLLRRGLPATAALRGRLGGTSCLAATTPLRRRCLLRRGLPATPLDRRSLLRRALTTTPPLRGRRLLRGLPTTLGRLPCRRLASCALPRPTLGRLTTRRLLRRALACASSLCRRHGHLPFSLVCWLRGRSARQHCLRRSPSS